MPQMHDLHMHYFSEEIHVNESYYYTDQQFTTSQDIHGQVGIILAHKAIPDETCQSCSLRWMKPLVSQSRLAGPEAVSFTPILSSSLEWNLGLYVSGCLDFATRWPPFFSHRVSEAMRDLFQTELHVFARTGVFLLLQQAYSILRKRFYPTSVAEFQPWSINMH